MPDQTQQFSFKVLTINIHKGFTAFNRRFILPELATPCVPSAPILFACRK